MTDLLMRPGLEILTHLIIEQEKCSFYDRCPLGSGRHRVKMFACLLACLIDLPTFSEALEASQNVARLGGH